MIVSAIIFVSLSYFLENLELVSEIDSKPFMLAFNKPWHNCPNAQTNERDNDYRNDSNCFCQHHRTF